MHTLSCPIRTALLSLGLTLSVLSPSLHAEEEVDFHFRPFWVEPADLIELGHGHLVAGIDHEQRPDRQTRRRTALPMEATLGLGAGFSTVLALEGGAYSVLNDHSHSHAASREAKLRYSLPEWKGINFLLVTGVEEPTGNSVRTYSNGYSFAFDTPLGTIGLGQTWDRRRAGEAHSGREAAVNYFRTGLGSDQRWAAGAELHHVHTAENTQHRFWLAGIGRVVGKGLMADIAIGGDLNHGRYQRITAGISYFY